MPPSTFGCRPGRLRVRPADGVIADEMAGGRVWRLPIGYAYGAARLRPGPQPGRGRSALGAEAGRAKCPAGPAIVPATVGGLFLTALGIHRLHEATDVGTAARPYDEGWGVLAMAMSGLMNLWGALLLILTYAYCRRRWT